MTGEPPFLSPIVHESPTLVADVIEGTLTKFLGASGFVRMIAASASNVFSEKTDGPTMLTALTIAYTGTPQSKLYGVALRVEIGTAQESCPTTAGLVPSQLLGSAVKTVLSPCLILIV